MVANLFFVYMWTLYVDYRLCKSKSSFKRLRRNALLPLLAVIILLIINIFTDSVFAITESGSFRVRPLWSLYVLVQLGYIIATARVLYSYKKSGGLHLFSIRSFIIPFVCGTIGEILIPGASLTTAGAAIGYLMIYIGMLQENTYEDSLTGFYNTFFLEKLSEEAQLGTYDFASGILFFANDIHKLMSESGIVATDELIRKLAAALREELPEGCETMYLGDGRFLILSQAADDQLPAVEMLMDIIKDAFENESSGALNYEGYYVFRKEGQDLGSFLSELSNKAGVLS
jgi:GGDEF domain-containing protein